MGTQNSLVLQILPTMEISPACQNCRLPELARFCWDSVQWQPTASLNTLCQ